MGPSSLSRMTTSTAAANSSGEGIGMTPDSVTVSFCGSFSEPFCKQR